MKRNTSESKRLVALKRAKLIYIKDIKAGINRN